MLCPLCASRAPNVFPVNAQALGDRSEILNPAFALGLALDVDRKFWRTDPTAKSDVLELLDRNAAASGEVLAGRVV